MDAEYLNKFINDLYQKYLLMSRKKAKLAVTEEALARLGVTPSKVYSNYDAPGDFAQAVAPLHGDLSEKFKEIIMYETGRTPSNVAVVARTEEIMGGIRDNWKVLGDVVIYSDEYKDVVYKKVGEESVGEYAVHIYLMAVIPRYHG